MQPDETRQIIFHPRPGLPFIQNSYRVEVKTDDSPVLACVQADDLRIGEGFYLVDDWPAAAEYLAKAVAEEPRDWWSLLLLEKAYQKLGQTRLAGECCARLDNLLPPSWGQQGVVMMSARELEDCLGYPLDWLQERAGLVWHRADLLNDEGKDCPHQYLKGPDFFLAPGLHLIRVFFAPAEQSPPAEWGRLTVQRDEEVVLDRMIRSEDAPAGVFSVDLAVSSLGERWRWEIKETALARGRTKKIVVQPSLHHWLAQFIITGTASDNSLERDAESPAAAGI